MNRLVAVVLLSAGCAAARPAPEPPAQTVVGPSAPDTQHMAELRRAAMSALARAREEATTGLGSRPTCPMPVFRGDAAVAPMAVFPPDSSRRHTMLVFPPGCRPRDN